MSNANKNEVLGFHIYFGKALKERGISTTDFAKSVEVNERSIRFWRTGKRIPSFEHEKLPLISQELEISLDELKAMISKSRQEQGPSNNNKKKEDKSSLPEVISADSINPQDFNEPLPESITRGKANINKSMIALVQSLGKPVDRKNNRILFIFQNRDVVFEKVLLDQWRSALKNAIDNGWFIEQIIQVDRNRERTLRTIFNILNYTNDENQYMLYKLKHRKPFDVSTGMLIVTGKAALISYATQDPDYIDQSIFIKAETEHEQINIYAQHFELLRQQADPVFIKYDNSQHQEILTELTESDKEAGDRIVFLKRISEVTRPEYFYNKQSNWARSIQKYYDMTDEQFEIHLATRELRHMQFRDVLRKNHCKYIYRKRDLKEFIKTGKCYPYYFEASHQERLDQLLETRRLILSPESNGRFDLALISEEEEDIIGNIQPCFLEIKDGILTTMEIPTGKRDKHGNLLHRWFLIKDPAITNAFNDHFSDVWDRLRDDSKGIATVTWLNKQINTLEDRLGLPRSMSLD
jgi:hypothetical protein